MFSKDIIIKIGLITNTGILLISLILIYIISKKSKNIKLLQIMLGFDLLIIWSIVSILDIMIDHSHIITHNQIAAFISILIVTASLVILKSREDMFKDTLINKYLYFSIMYGGVFLSGFLAAQIVFPSILIIQIHDINYNPITKYNLVFGSIFIIWGIIAMIYFVLTEIKIRPKYQYFDDLLSKRLYISAGTLLISSVIMYFIQPLILINSNTTTNIFIYYVINRTLLSISVIIIYLSIIKNPENVFYVNRIIRYAFDNNKISLSLVGINTTGPYPIHIQGFDFVEKDKKDQYVQNLGIIAMTTLGMGTSYIEGSAIIPIPSQEQLVGVLFSSWVADVSQDDNRLKNKNYIILIVLVPKSLENILIRKDEMVSEFIKFSRNVNDLNDIQIHELSDFVQNQFIKLAIPH
ncbi:MAG: hypothetical protein OEZ01_10695 [Candidatus Heimdallarchaeota archaeon]|nr:hypothetical protein [Candidatus Heimdallarchaeota archaeon]MDH5646469.1 hypothetical protein [Candidatus Heimdallarchaeota archaeon]